MRPSELKPSLQFEAASPRKLKFPRDDKADPPISVEEALAAGTANCLRHLGLIGQRGEKEGMVFLCTSCGKFWRYANILRPSTHKFQYPR